MSQIQFEENSSRNPIIATLTFPISAIFELMAEEYTHESAEAIIKASLATGKGVLKKYSIKSENLDRIYASKIAKSTFEILQETFLAELKSRFMEDEQISINFYNDFVELKIANIFDHSTDDIKTLFKALFVKKYSKSIILNEANILCENSTIIANVSKSIKSDTNTDFIKLVCKGFPFYITSEEFENDKNLKKKFDTLKKIRQK